MVRTSKRKKKNTQHNHNAVITLKSLTVMKEHFIFVLFVFLKFNIKFMSTVSLNILIYPERYPGYVGK